jgi:hypothetical protein
MARSRPPNGKEASEVFKGEREVQGRLFDINLPLIGPNLLKTTSTVVSDQINPD